MSGPEDVASRLRAANPISTDPYDAVRFGLTVERILSSRSRLERTAFQAGHVKALAGATAAAAAGAALVLSLIGMSGSAPSLALRTPHPLVLSKGSASELYPARSSDPEVRRGTYFGPFFLRYKFRVDASFSDVPTSLRSYPAIGPSNPKLRLQSWAFRLHIPGQVVTNAPASWSVGNATSPFNSSTVTLDKGRTGIYQFDYRPRGENSTKNPCAPTAPQGLHPRHADDAAMNSAAKALISSLGLSYELGEPIFSIAPTTSPRVSCGTSEMNEAILIDGVLTDQSVSIAFTSSGHIVNANVPVFALGRSAIYPSETEVGASKVLVHSTSSAGSSSLISGSSQSARRSQESRHLIVVELRSAITAYHAFETVKGSTWFLPVYIFHGEGLSPIVTPKPLPWTGTVLAVSSSYVLISNH